ncbi:MAG: 2-dehydropantoate 2-reductase, partial [Actinomycetota bacterium]
RDPARTGRAAPGRTRRGRGRGMKVLIAGAGGVGGYYGGRLLAGGHDVWFLARGANLEGLRANGLSVVSEFGDLRFKTVNTADDGADAGRVDLVVFCVKTYDNASGADAIEAAVGEGTAIVSLQNGVENEAFLSSRFPGAETVAGISRIEAWIDGPGVVRQRGPQTNLTIGAPHGGPSERADEIGAAFAKAGVPCETSEDMPAVLWFKLLGICGFGGVSAYCTCTLGEILADEDLRALITGCWNECGEVARARGIGLPEDAAGAMLSYGENVLNPEFKSSMCRDVERGKPLEVDAINGAIVRFGEEAGVATPNNRGVVERLRPLHEAAMVARA